MTPSSPSGPSLGRRVRRRLVRFAHGLGLTRRRDRSRAALDLRDATTVLFLCYGNICRSPFAARYAREISPPGIRIASAGVHPTGGRSSPDAARRAARRLGVDLDDHRSRVTDGTELERADVILVFDARNYLDALERHGEARSRIHFLGNFDPAGPVEIADPWGESEEAFLETYRRIGRAVEAAAAEVGWPDRIRT
jgi:protein-tyrosine-phosphatase